LLVFIVITPGLIFRAAHNEYAGRNINEFQHCMKNQA